MGETTGISWCDRTWSPWYGCTQVSMGEHGACVGCYARFISETRHKRVVFGGPGRGEGTRDFRPDSAWKEPLRWEREAAVLARGWAEAHPDGRPWPYSPFIFPSMCDPFDNHTELRFERRRFFDLISATPHLTWLLLTKRPGNVVNMFVDAYWPEHVGPTPEELIRDWPPNAAIGFTAVTQAEMDRDGARALIAFKSLRPPFLFWSGEPLMERVVLPPELLALGARFWAITGGETDQGAHRARPTPHDAETDIRDQCATAGVPYHRKQAGEWIRVADLRGLPGGQGPGLGAFDHCQHDIETDTVRVSKKTAGRLLDGVLHDARPKVR